MTRANYFCVMVAGLMFLSGCADASIQPPSLPEIPQDEREAQAEVDRQRAEDDLLREFPDAEVPTVARVRYVDLTEWAVAMAECLTEAGFASEEEDGSLLSAAPPGQEQPFAVATYTCTIKYPIDPRVNIPLNEDQIRYLYEYYTRVLTPCVEAEGYEVPDPPSQQTYQTQYGQPGSWNPYELVAEATTSDEEWQRINKLCPQVPSGVYG